MIHVFSKVVFIAARYCKKGPRDAVVSGLRPLRRCRARADDIATAWKKVVGQHGGKRIVSVRHDRNDAPFPLHSQVWLPCSPKHLRSSVNPRDGCVMHFFVPASDYVLLVCVRVPLLKVDESVYRKHFVISCWRPPSTKTNPPTSVHCVAEPFPAAVLFVLAVHKCNAKIILRMFPIGSHPN